MCKPEWNREAITVFFRLPSLRRLQATPPLQTSLVPSYTYKNITYFTKDEIDRPHGICKAQLT